MRAGGEARGLMAYSSNLDVLYRTPQSWQCLMHQVSFQPEDNDHNNNIMHANDCHAGQVSAATVLESVMS